MLPEPSEWHRRNSQVTCQFPSRCAIPGWKKFDSTSDLQIWPNQWPEIRTIRWVLKDWATFSVYGHRKVVKAKCRERTQIHPWFAISQFHFLHGLYKYVERDRWGTSFLLATEYYMYSTMSGRLRIPGIPINYTYPISTVYKTFFRKMKKRKILKETAHNVARENIRSGTILSVICYFTHENRNPGSTTY